MYNLFLDDFRIPEMAAAYMPIETKALYRTKDWVVAKSHKEFVKIVEERGLPQLVSFDHDLADAHYFVIEPMGADEAIDEFYQAAYLEETGYSTAKWLINYCLDNKQELPNFLVHSQNPVGADNIEKLLLNFKKHQQDDKKKT